MYNLLMDTLQIIDKIEQIYLTYGYPLVFISSLIETSPIGFIIPGGLVVSIGGFFAYGKPLVLVGVVLAGTSGMMATFLLAYLLGKKYGMSLAKKFNQQDNAKRAKHLLEKHGPVILTTSLLANLTRFWIAFVAGSQEFKIFKFILYATVASLTWNSLLVFVGYLAGSERGKLESGVTRLGIFSWALVVVAGTIIYWKIKKEYKEIGTS
jgi:membrane protein DedA with SNARE-associated domain